MRDDISNLAPSASPDIERARGIIRQVFRHYPGAVAIRLWNDETVFVGGGAPPFTLVIRTAAVFRDLLLWQDPLRLAHAYFSGTLDIEGDLYEAIRFSDAFEAARIPLSERLSLFLKLAPLFALPAREHSKNGTTAVRQSFMSRLWNGHSRLHNRNAIAFHYDLSNDFYRLWLDEQMVYSCGYFESADDTLEQAQENKLEHICRKLRLQPGERMLDIGCGWGALAIWAAKHHGVKVEGITLSKRQLEYGQARVRAEGLEDRVTLSLCDYRDMPGENVFDKVSSVGMFEHVGIKNLPTYFRCVNRLLKPGGLFMNHGITHDEEGWNKTTSTEFINRYVFPDGELDRLSNVQLQMERAEFEIWDVEGLRPHYAKTLRHWVTRLEQRRDEALQYVNAGTWRIWQLYMAASAVNFELGDLGLYQILGSKRGRYLDPLPLTRRDLYR